MLRKRQKKSFPKGKEEVMNRDPNTSSLSVKATRQGKVTKLSVNLKELAKLRASNTRSKYPKVPDRAFLMAKSCEYMTDNGLTERRIDAISYIGYQPEGTCYSGRILETAFNFEGAEGRRNTIGPPKYIPGIGTIVMVKIASISIKFKVKVGKDEYSEIKDAYQGHGEANGGIYIRTRSYESFVIKKERRLK
ncbi:hypothetical protein [Cyclobacterium roseum]|uniref:hypothetical protein n=1 Tax=Cyclobacterium roseum TaxID=2666137 RepID=UPI00139170A0|nr:hypothetical protein [Cyclobacterium roseum]